MTVRLPKTQEICAREGCVTTVWSRGLCKSDYMKAYRAGTLPPKPVRERCKNGHQLVQGARQKVCRVCQKGHRDKWNENNREHYNALAVVSVQRRRALQCSAKGVFSYKGWEDRKSYYAGRCWLQLEGCTGVGDTIDYVIPLSKGGTNWPANLRPACRSCNSRKKNKSLKELEQVS
jgi:5-methylcytosine-specific restriction endonuclease McrA